MAGLDPAIHVFRPNCKNKTWITGSSPVMTIECVESQRAIASLRFDFQTATRFPARARSAGWTFSSPRKPRGMERRKAQFVSSRSLHAACDGHTQTAHRLSALQHGDFWRRDRSFGCGIRTPFGRPFIPADFPPFAHTACSHWRQSHVVGSVGDLSPPGRVVTNHTRGRRILLRLFDASRSAPHEQDAWNIFL